MLPAPDPQRRLRVDSVDVLVVSWNGRRHLETLLPALAEQRDPGTKVRVRLFDNGSTDGTAAWVRSEHSEVAVVEQPVNLGFAAANNRLAEASAADALVLVNNDTRPHPDWLAELVAGLRAAPGDVAALAGCILDWDGERLDFGRGVMTFDGHALQFHHGRPLALADVPGEGVELPFPCGGNMIVRRDAFLAAGGFDGAYFAYLEDVDLGWRLWSGGERVLSAPRAVVNHRSMATSRRLGNASRGLLFERNAWLTAARNYDAEIWPRILPVIQMTLLARTQHLLVHCNPNGELLARNQFAAPVAEASAWAAARDSVPSTEVVDERRTSGALQSGAMRAGGGHRSAWQRARDVVALRRRLRGLARRLGGAPAWAPVVVDHQTIAQVRALSAIITGLDDVMDQRVRIQARRRRPDREIFERFPLHVVATYPGDEDLFASAGFEAMWPQDLQPVRCRLEDIVEIKEPGS